MEKVILEVTTRKQESKAKDLVSENIVPLEYYGKGVQNLSLQAPYKVFRQAFKAAGGNTIIELVIDGKDKKTVLIHDIQYDPMSDRVKHVDLINVKMDEEIKTHIPLRFTGIAPAVKELGGVLTPLIDEIEVKCLPAALVADIEVSITTLVDFHSIIHVKDLNIPSGITVLTHLEDAVITVSAPREEKEETPVVAAEATTPEAGAAPAAGATPAAPKA